MAGKAKGADKPAPKKPKGKAVVNGFTREDCLALGLDPFPYGFKPK